MKRLLASLALAIAVHGWLLGLERPLRAPRVQPPRPVMIELAALPIPEPPPAAQPPEPPPPPPEPRPAPRLSKPKPAPQPRPIETPIAAVAADPQPVLPAPVPPAAMPQPASAPTVAVAMPAPVLVQARPRYRANPAPAYPSLARRRGLEGTVLLEVLVGTDGKVKDLKIAESSGHGLLDEAAVSSVKGWAFEPGQRGDHPIEMWVRVPVAFVLQ